MHSLQGLELNLWKITWVMRRLQWYNTQIFQHRLIQTQTFTDILRLEDVIRPVFVQWYVLCIHLCIFPPPNRTLLWWVIIPTFCCLKSSRSHWSHCVIADDAWFCPKSWWWNIVFAPVVTRFDTSLGSEPLPPLPRYTWHCGIDEANYPADILLFNLVPLFARIMSLRVLSSVLHTLLLQGSA